MKTQWVAPIFLLISLNGAASVKTCHQSWCYYKDSVEGWSVFYSEDLQTGDSGHLEKVKSQLKSDLKNITEIIPSEKLSKFKKIPIYVSLSDPKGKYPGGVYHYSKEILKERGLDPEKFQSIEIANSENYLSWHKNQPAIILHELGHAYFEQYLTNSERKKIAQAYKTAMAQQRYK